MVETWMQSVCNCWYALTPFHTATAACQKAKHTRYSIRGIQDPWKIVRFRSIELKIAIPRYRKKHNAKSFRSVLSNSINNKKYPQLKHINRYEVRAPCVAKCFIRADCTIR